MIRSIFTLVCVAFSLCCNGQDFISKYRKLEKENLAAFFEEWKNYSDSIAQYVEITDSVIAKVLETEFMSHNAEPDEDDGITPRYCVVFDSIRIERYDMKVGTTYKRLYKLEFNEKKCIGSVMIVPPLPKNGLYLTIDIDKLLSNFVGGLDGKASSIKQDNVQMLSQYVPVKYGHWGGYWWFETFPKINAIRITRNAIIVYRRTSWWTGDEILYVKEGDTFVRRDEPISTWVE